MLKHIHNIETGKVEITNFTSEEIERRENEHNSNLIKEKIRQQEEQAYRADLQSIIDVDELFKKLGSEKAQLAADRIGLANADAQEVLLIIKRVLTVTEEILSRQEREIRALKRIAKHFLED